MKSKVRKPSLNEPQLDEKQKQLKKQRKTSGACWKSIALTNCKRPYKNNGKRKKTDGTCKEHLRNSNLNKLQPAKQETKESQWNTLENLEPS